VKVTLGELVSLRRGNSYKGSLAGESGFPLLGLGTISREGGFKGEKLRFYPEEFSDRIAVSAGDVYVSLKDMTQEAALLGAAARVPEGIERARLTQDTIAVDILDGSPISSEYLYWTLRSPQCRRHCKSLATGTTNLDLARNDFLSYEFELPSLDEQRATGEVLGALDDKIAANRRVIGSSVALATQIVAREAVGPDRQLSEIADVQMGSSPRGADLNEDGDGMEFYQGVRDFGPLSPTPRVFATVTPRRANAGDTLLAVRAPVGEVNWARNETCIGRGLAAVRSVGTPTTIHYLLKRFASRWDEHEGSGTVFSSVTGPQVKGMRFPTVPEASAEDVEQVVASIHHRALSAEAESEVLARTRDELLPLLMNGRISVKDAERVVGDVV